MKEQSILGRTVKKWQPFASIPEQFAGVSKIIQSQTKVPQPLLDEDEQGRINYLLNEVIGNNQTVKLIYLLQGRLEYVVGILLKLDQISGTILVLHQDGVKSTLSISRLVDIVKI